MLEKLKIWDLKYVNFLLFLGVRPLSGSGPPFRNFWIHDWLWICSTWTCYIILTLYTSPVTTFHSITFSLLQAKCGNQIKWPHASLKIYGSSIAGAIKYKVEFDSILNIWNYVNLYIDGHMLWRRVYLNFFLSSSFRDSQWIIVIYVNFELLERGNQ
jgi:hypothetical protein